MHGAARDPGGASNDWMPEKVEHAAAGSVELRAALGAEPRVETVRSSQ